MVIGCGAAAEEHSAAVSSAAGAVLSPEMVALWRHAQAVCFDVDSTVCEDEGIDELAAFCGAGEAVAAWTARCTLPHPIIHV
jgi:phosphoserine phosphatase